MNVFATGFPARLLLLVGPAVLLGGCLSISEPRDPLLWEGPFVPVPDASQSVSGMAYMAAGETHTDAAVGLTGDPGAALVWVVRNGACSASGNPLAPLTVFPPIAVSVDGVGEAVARINRRVEHGTYSVEVFAGSIAGERLACADLLARS
jgi:hypothetical protein